MASSSHAIQQLIPALAASLARLRRTPGRSEAWLDDALPALERSDAARYGRLRRRIGFARRLGDLAGFGLEETATVTVGLFFNELIDGQPGRGANAAASAWQNYLLRNEDWLAPAFALCESIAAEGWEISNDKAKFVAKVTVFFDTETLEQHERPLLVLQQLNEEVQSPLAQRELIPLLWSEGGQELCDHHFRRHPHGYTLDAADLRSCLGVLRRLAPGSTLLEAEETPQPVGFNFDRRRQASSTLLEAEETPQPVGFNFDRRRQALRRHPWQEEPAGSPPQPDRQPVNGDGAPVPKIDRAEEPAGAQSSARDEEAGEPDDGGAARRGEDQMEQPRTISPVPRGRRDALEMIQKLQEVRLQLGQIQRVAVDAEQLLTGLAPQLDELAAWIADMEAILERWRGKSGIPRAA